MSLEQTDFAQAPPAPPNVMAIFGAGGDLTRRKLIPALFHLCNARLLPDDFAVVGVDRLDLDDAGFREHVADEARQHLGEAYDQAVWDRLARRIHYMKGNILELDTYQAMRRRLEELDGNNGTAGN